MSQVRAFSNKSWAQSRVLCF